MFKCLIFVQGQTASKDAEIRSRLLSKLEQDSKLTIRNIVEEYQGIINLCHDSEKNWGKIFCIYTPSKKEKGKGNTVKKKFYFKLCYECG